MTEELNITTKTIQIGDDAEFPNYETRYFADSKDGFDGTAQGYGYKSKQKLMVAYWYSQNKHKIHSLNIETKKFMKENSEIKILLKEYFSDQNCLYYAKDGEEMSIQDFIITILRDKSIINTQEITEKLNQNKHLWKTIMQGNY